MSSIERYFLGLLATCLHVIEFRFAAMLCSNSGNDNSDVGHMTYSRGTYLARRP